MAKLVFGMNMSLDGFVDHMKMGPPDDTVFNYFTEYVRAQTAIVYGTNMYEIMRYWDEEQPGWEKVERDFAEAWRSKPKWVVSHTLKEVGPNATLVEGNVKEFLRKLKAEETGDIEVTGPNFAGSLANSGLIDEYRLFLRPVILGEGQPFFVGSYPVLHLVSVERIGDEVIKLTYVPK